MSLLNGLVTVWRTIWLTRLLPEVVQTSAMDCGPATLKCVLEGAGIAVSYGRLREACQTDVDGTSIDQIEIVANQLGVKATQVMLPIDHIHNAAAETLPAIVVVKRSDGATHFVVVWQLFVDWALVMDPAVGRRWVKWSSFSQDIYQHQQEVAEQDWRAWAETESFLSPLRARLVACGVRVVVANRLILQACENARWFGIATLDAATRLLTRLCASGGVKRGHSAEQLLETVVRLTLANEQDIHRHIPHVYWSVTPSHVSTLSAIERAVAISHGKVNAAHMAATKLNLKGAVLLEIALGKTVNSSMALNNETLSPELKAAISEPSLHPARMVWRFLKEDGLLAPAMLAGAMVIAAGMVMLQLLLFKGMFDIRWALNLPSQRMFALGSLLAFLLLVLMIEVPIAMESMRLGRQLETRLRMALLTKLPTLSDRYFASRPISDMAERSHSLYLSRLVPGLGVHLVQSMAALLFTLLGMAFLDKGSVLWGVAIVLATIVFTTFMQPLLNERDLRTRSHIGAMNSFYLDALMGASPIRAHRAQDNVRRQHEGVLVEWVRATRSLIHASLLLTGLQSCLTLGLAGGLLYAHFMRMGTITGGDLLLVFWTLRLPSIAKEFTTLAQQYPAQRNVLLRLMEPLSAPEPQASTRVEQGSTSEMELANQSNETPAIQIVSGHVIAAGHRVLESVNLQISRGQHVAIVGASGAGKSSLLGVLLGWHRLTEGQLRCHGRLLQPTDVVAMRRRIAWVDPAIQLWDASLMENLHYALETPDTQSMQAILQTADLRGVVQSLPEGLQSYLGEGGARLSGGEGQRIRLARALFQKDIDFVLLDEPFRGLDRDTRSRLLNETRAWWKDQTLLCVSHDISETLGFDRVILIEDGRIVEDDTPSKLAFGDSCYRRLLQAEAELRNGQWNHQDWRVMSMVQGQLTPINAGAQMPIHQEFQNVH